MSDNPSRREVITLAAAAVAASGIGSAAAADYINRVYVNRCEVVLPRAGGPFAVQLTTTLGRVIDVELSDADSRAQFMTFLELALGRGRLSLEMETDGKTVRAFRLETP